MKSSSKEKILQRYTVTTPNQLLNYLFEQKAKGSRSAVKSLLAHKLVKVNGVSVSKHDTPLVSGDVVTVVKLDPAQITKKLDGITIIYEDEAVVVVDKEHGILSINTNKEKERSVYTILSAHVKSQDKNNKIFVLHRLDRETSGLMVYAKSVEVKEAMQSNWDEVIQLRSYVAVVSGVPKETEGTIITWLTENKNFQVFSCKFDNGGQKAITHYKTLKVCGKFSLLELQLQTGRKNQIRVQLESLGHSIVGDKKYGSLINPIKRIALHAQELSLIHPQTKELMEFKSVMPISMQNLVPTH